MRQIIRINYLNLTYLIKFSMPNLSFSLLFFLSEIFRGHCIVNLDNISLG